MALHNEEDREFRTSYLELKTGETPKAQVQFRKQLTTGQQWEVAKFVKAFQDVFQQTPGWARGVEHDIRTLPGTLVRERWRPIP